VKIEKRVQLCLRDNMQTEGGRWFDISVDGGKVVQVAWGGGGWNNAPIGSIQPLLQELFELGFAMGRDTERGAK
jgi:hypothetical protein